MHTRSSTSAIRFEVKPAGEDSGGRSTWPFSRLTLEGVGDTGVRAPAHPSPFGTQANARGRLPQQQGLVPPTVTSGASEGWEGAARVRFRPVTETLGTLGQADAVVSASRVSR